MKFFVYIIIGAIVLLVVLSIIYFLLLLKLKNLNDKIYKLKKEEVLKEENVLIVYQPSIHKTINNLVNIIKDEIIQKGYGYTMHTLDKNNDDYSKYRYVIFVAPVYFGQIHNQFLNILSKSKIKNLCIVYNGLNKESNNEDRGVEQITVSRYKKIKVYTQEAGMVKEFIHKEVL